MSSPSLKIITALFDERFLLFFISFGFHVRFRSHFFIRFSLLCKLRNSGPISNDDDDGDDDILSTCFFFFIFLVEYRFSVRNCLNSVEKRREKERKTQFSKTTTQIYRMTDEHKLRVFVDIIIEVVLL